MKKNLLQKTLCLVLVVSFGTSSAFAYPQGAYTHVYDESYNASSPVGYFENYSRGGQRYYNNYNQNNYVDTSYRQPQQNYYDGYAENNIAYNVPVEQRTIENIQVPQSYSKHVVTQDVYEDTRPSVDKNIDRAGRVVGVLGVASLLGLGVAALIRHL